MSSAGLRPVFVVAAKRTPFGTFLGSLQNVTATDLAAHATKAALASGNVPAEAVDAVIVGNVAQVSELTSLFFTSTLPVCNCRTECSLPGKATCHILQSCSSRRNVLLLCKRSELVRMPSMICADTHTFNSITPLLVL